MAKALARAASLALALALAALAHATPARADDPPCGSGVHRWVLAAARDTGTRTRAAACPPGRVVLQLEPEGAPALRVEVSEGEGPAFRRVGRFRVSPLLQVYDFRAVPAPQRESFERVCAWLGAHPDAVRFSGEATLPPAVRRALDRVGARPMGPLLPLLALTLALAATLRRPRARPSRSDAVAFSAVALLALALRLALGVWGPLHVNGLAPLWVMSAATNPDEVGYYGPGYPELYGWLAGLARGAPDTAIFAANATLSALTAALAYATARLAGVDARRALVAGALLALEPVAVRTSASEAYMAPIAGLLALGAAAALASANAFGRGERSRGALWAAAAGALCAQAVRIHPVGWIPAALAPLAALGARGELPLRRRSTAALATGAIVGAAVALGSAGVVLQTAQRIRAGELFAPSLAYPPGTLAAASLAAALALAVARPRWIVPPGVLAALAWLLTRRNYAQSEVWEGAFGVLYATPVAVAAAAVLPAGPRWRRAASLGGAAAVVAVIALGLPVARAPVTAQQREYAWLRDWMRGLPTGCRVASVAFGGHRNLFLPEYVATPRPLQSFVRFDARQPVDVGGVLGPVGCTYYVHTSLCSTREGRPACEEVESQLTLAPGPRALFPAVPDAWDQDYLGPMVPVAISRVVAVSPPAGAAGPGAR